MIYQDRNDFIRSFTLENGPIDLPFALSLRADNMAFFNMGVGSSKEYETVLERAKFFREAFTIAERENPNSSATFCASFLTFGSILILKADVFIYPKVYTK